jgi:hypothetical protein
LARQIALGFINRLVQELGVGVSKQRLDSTYIESNMAKVAVRRSGRELNLWTARVGINGDFRLSIQAVLARGGLRSNSQPF